MTDENKATVTLLRGSLTETQRAILDDVWAHIKRTNIGLPERPLLAKYGKTTLQENVAALGGTVISSGHEENKKRYDLSIVGVFLTSDGPRLDKLVGRYLLGLREVYTHNEEVERLSSKDLETWQPGFTGNELIELRHILYRAHNSLASGFGGSSGSEWFIRVDDDVVELRDVTDWQAYIHSKVVQWYGTRANSANPLVGLSHGDGLVGCRVLQPSSSDTKIEKQSALHPWPVIRGFLLTLDSYDVPGIVDRAGLVVDWRLTERENYSDKTRLAAYRPRIDKAYQTLSGEEDRLRVAYIVGREVSKIVPTSEFSAALRSVGWELRDTLLPIGDTVRELFFGEKTEHDAYVGIRGILQGASSSLVVVDPYVDQSILTLLTACAKANMNVRILTSRIPSDFALEAKKWLTQHQGVVLEVRTSKEFHDRFIVLDGQSCWHIGASLKDAGAKAFMISQIEDDANAKALVKQIDKSWHAAVRVVPS